MSKNYEALLKAGRELEFLQTASKRETPQKDNARIAVSKTRSRVRIDANVHEEEVKMVQRVFMLGGMEANRAVVFCGVDEAEGAAGICARAGENLAEMTSAPVCLIEGDLQSFGLQRYFELEDERGLTDALVEERPFREYLQQLQGTKLSLLLAGTRRNELLSPWQSEKMRVRLEELREEFPYLLFYAPPASLRADAMLLGHAADGVVLILETNASRRETAKKVAESFAAAKVNVLGAVLNNRTFPVPEAIYRKL